LCCRESAGSLKRLDLSNNALSGVIPSQIGQLHGATVLLKENRFQNSSMTAPLSLCLEREVKEFDLANDATLCPIERNALSDFYDSAKGVEWTDGSLWLHEYASCCKWKGVTCDDDLNVIKLNLANNGLSGRLSASIGNLTSIEVLDLSDNDIKVRYVCLLKLYYWPLPSFIANSFIKFQRLSLNSSHRDRFRLRSASLKTSFTCVSATMPSQERHLKAWER
jgi:hypothetical protein